MKKILNWIIFMIVGIFVIAVYQFIGVIALTFIGFCLKMFWNRMSTLSTIDFILVLIFLGTAIATIAIGCVVLLFSLIYKGVVHIQRKLLGIINYSIYGEGFLIVTSSLILIFNIALYRIDDETEYKLFLSIINIIVGIIYIACIKEALKNNRHKVVIIGNKKYTILSAPHDPTNGIYSGDYIDGYGNKGLSGYTYFTGEAAMREAKKQGKTLFDMSEGAEDFIYSLPGDSISAKVKKFISIMGLQKAGYWLPESKIWYAVGFVGYATLSGVDKDGRVYAAYWLDDDAGMEGHNQICPTPVVASEDC